MSALERLLLVLAVALLGAGIETVSTRAVGHSDAVVAAGPATAATTLPRSTTSPPATSPVTTSAPTTSTPTGSATVATTVPAAGGAPGPGTADLLNGLITPTDMGGYYRIAGSAAAAVLDSAPCLASLQPSPAASGRATTALLGPDAHSVPTIVEVVDSYPGSSAAQVYRDVASTIASCRSLAFDFGGTQVSAPVQVESIPPVGQADAVWSGTFTYSGSRFSVQLGVVLQAQTVLALMWVDTIPPSAAIMGNFTSTLSLAIGKLA